MSGLSTKLLDEKQLDVVVSRLKKEGTKIVFTNGCFDIIHVGHIRCLKEARELGDVLIVGLNSDTSTRMIKGEHRPVIPEHERAEILAAIEYVDYVTLFSDKTPYELIKRILPDVLVKGGDWPVDEIVGKDIVEKNGGKVVSVPFHTGSSSTSIIKTIKKL